MAINPTARVSACSFFFFFQTITVVLRFHFLSCRRRERAGQRKREGGGSSCSEENERGGLATFKRPSSRVFFIIRILTRCFVFSFFFLDFEGGRYYLFGEGRCFAVFYG